MTDSWSKSVGLYVTVVAAFALGVAGCSSGSEPDDRQSGLTDSATADASPRPAEPGSAGTEGESEGWTESDGEVGGDPGVSELPDPPTLTGDPEEPAGTGITVGVPASPPPGCDETDNPDRPALCDFLDRSADESEGYPSDDY
ncbi:hypothetical protein GCM10010423_58730 [Streptomyces levis]|uniref:Secreted protein n=1 Tax=Streptomyces levis TaxID=285566 RepID=A0ABN3P213_9ACTN